MFARLPPLEEWPDKCDNYGRDLLADQELLGYVPDQTQTRHSESFGDITREEYNEMQREEESASPSGTNPDDVLFQAVGNKDVWKRPKC